jgi:hypothetical protein
MGNEIIKFISERGAERSTWLGIISVIGALGYAIDPALIEIIIHGGSFIGGIILLITREKKVEDVPKTQKRKEKQD